jgi:uncharacterized membrane protein YhaH (DUF805 family)
MGVAVFEYFTTFYGRASRSEFWITNIIFYVLNVVLQASSRILDHMNGGSQIIFGLFLIVLYLAVLWSSVSFLARRWHDRGKSGLWCLLLLVPIVGPIWTLIECGFFAGRSDSNFSNQIYVPPNWPEVSREERHV